MNRKFFNGLLLLALATGGVGTFTSCTDHEQDFQNKVLEDQKDFSDQIAAIRAFLGEPIEGSSLDDRIKAVYEDRINGILNRLNDIEKDYVTEEELTNAIAAVREEVNDLFKNYYDKAYIDEKIGENGSRIVALEDLAKVQEYELAELQKHFDVTLDQLNDLFARYALIRTSQITSIIVEQTYNPVFGTLNLPIGLESNMILGYYADIERDVEFPYGESNKYEGVQNTEVFGTSGITLPYEGTVLELKTGDQALPTLGNLYLTINPTDVNFNGQKVELVKSNGEALPLGFTAQESDKVLYLGYTRSGNGFYEAEIKPAEETGAAADSLIEATKFEFEPQLKSAFKNIINNPGKETLAQLAQAIYSQFDGKIPAYAAKVSWTEPVVEGVSVDSVGTLASEGETITRSVLSGYDLAVASFKPLSYSTDLGIDTDKKLPLIGSLKERIDQVFNYLHNHLDFGFKPATVNDFTIDLSGVKVTVNMEDIEIDLSGVPVYGAIVNADGTLEADESDLVGVLGDEAKITLGYDGSKVYVPGDNSTALNPLVDAIESAIEDVLNGEGDNSLRSQIDSQLKTQIQKIVDQINEQLEAVQTKVYDSLASIQSKVDAELSGSMGSALQSLVDLYDSLAERINSILGGDTSFFQVLLGYEGVDGGIHHLSSVASDPTYVDKGAIELFMTSHNFEFIVPSFKKYVAITKVGDDVATAALNSQAGEDLNTILDGRQQRIGLNTAALESGKVYQLFYQSLDYRGRTSTMTYYIKVK